MKMKIKQIASLALAFLMLGGCAGINKNIRQTQTEAQITVSETAEREKTLVSAETAEMIEKTTVSQGEDATESMASSEKTTDEKTSATRKATTAKAATTKRVTTTQKAETAKRVTTAKAPETTKKVTTTKAATTSREETTTALPKQNDEGIIIGLKNIRFCCDMQSITDALGSPSETVTETLSAGGTVKSLVYAENYSEFAVLQLLNGKLFAFYTVAENTLVTDGESSYSLRTGGDTEFGDVKISVYKDSKRGGKAYALKASYSGLDYLPHELTSAEGQERLIFHTTNAVRAVNGLYALEYSEKASDCVRKHCEDMSERNYFSHDTPEGVTSSQRMRNSGIEYTSCGENLAAGYLDAFGIIGGWYNSSGHRKNMLDSEYRYLGVCMVEGNESYNIYAGQNYYV